MIFTVYILYSSTYDKHYTGYTSDIDARLISHNSKGKGWTARYRPWKVIYTRVFTDKSSAMAHEKWLKSGAGRDFVNTIPH